MTTDAKMVLVLLFHMLMLKHRIGLSLLRSQFIYSETIEANYQMEALSALRKQYYNTHCVTPVHLPLSE